MKSWTEKYRPTVLSDVRGNDEVINALKSFKTVHDLPNMILHGPPGSGKTSSILAMAKSFFDRNTMATMVLELNAGDARGIDTIRNEIHYFTQCSSVAEKATRAVKLIILDEADALTGCAQRALRHLLESSGHRARFCLCCNYITKLSSGLRSRCTSFSFSGVGKTQLARTLKTVARKERLDISVDGLNAVIDVCAGDARKAINLLQSFSLGHPTSPTVTRNEQAVYDSCGLPSPFEIGVLLEALLDQSLPHGYDTLHSFVSHKQLAVVQIISPLVEHMVANNSCVMTAERTGNVLLKLAGVERCLSEGGSECIAIGAVVGAFHIE